MPWFASDEQKAQEAAALESVRALTVEALAADILERVFGVNDAGQSANMAFGLYKAAHAAALTDEDKPVFAEAVQHLLNHRAIALDGFRGSNSGHVFFILTRRGRELLDRGEHIAALAA